MSNEARNRLRSMGGIMASSPELMQAAMPQYQEGGSVRAPAGRGTMLDGQMYLLMPDGSVVEARSGVAADPQTRRAVMQKLNVPPEVNAPMEPAVAPIPSYRLDGPLTRGGGAVSPLPTPAMPLEPRVPAGIEVALPERMDARVMRNILAGEDRTLNQQTIPTDLPEEVTVDALSTVPSDIAPTLPAEDLLSTTENLGGRNRAAQRESAAEQNMAAAAAAEAEARNISLDPRAARAASPRMEAEAEAQAETQAAVDAALDRRMNADAEVAEQGLAADVRRVLAETATAAEDTDTSSLADLDENLPPPPPPGDNTPGARRTLRDRFDQRLSLFKQLYGEDDDARARDRAMSLAMLGLAIASGQSPNALSNIAEGALVGLQGMSEQSRARREREQGIRSAALESVLDEQTAADAAAAEAAEGEAERMNRLEVARIRAEGGESGSGGFLKSAPPSRIYADAVEAARKFYTEQSSPPEGMSLEEAVKQKAQQDLMAAINLDLASDRLTQEEANNIQAAIPGFAPAVPGSSAGESAADLSAPPGAQPGQRVRDNSTGITYIVQGDGTMRPEG